MAQEKVQEQAGVKVQKMGLDMMKEQAVALDKLLSTAKAITDQNMGQRVNILA